MSMVQRVYLEVDVVGAAHCLASTPMTTDLEDALVVGIEHVEVWRREADPVDERRDISLSR